MKQLTWLIAIMVGLGSCALIVTRVVGQNRVNGLALAFAHSAESPCDDPCLFGVQIGQTRLDQAIPRLQGHPLLRDLEVVDSPARNGVQFVGADVCIGFAADTQGVIVGIDLQVRRQFSECLDRPRILKHVGPSLLTSASLGDVISQLGPPDRFRLIENQMGLATRAFYDKAHIEVTTTRRKLYWLRRSEALVVLYIGVKNRTVVEEPRRWMGFTHVVRYIKASRTLSP